MSAEKATKLSAMNLKKQQICGGKSHISMDDLNTLTPQLLTPTSELRCNPLPPSYNHLDKSPLFDFGDSPLDSHFERSRTPSLTFAEDDDEEYDLVTSDEYWSAKIQCTDTEPQLRRSLEIQEATPLLCKATSPERFQNDLGLQLNFNTSLVRNIMDSSLQLSEPSLNYEGLYNGKSFATIQADFMRQHQQQLQQQSQQLPASNEHTDSNPVTAIDPAMQHTANMSNFNLSDFLSVSDNDQFQIKHPSQSQLQSQQVDSVARASQPPEKPLTISTRPQYLRDAESGPRSEMSSPVVSSSDLLGHYVRPLQTPTRSLSFHSGQQTMDPHNLFSDHKLGTGMQRPTETLFRSHSDLPTISCDPSHVATTQPPHGVAASAYFHNGVFGQNDNNIQPPPIYLEEDARISPKSASPFSSPNTPMSSLWNEERRADISPSPLGSYVMTPQSSYSGYGQSTPDLRLGMMRGQRLQASSPYGSPMMHATPSASIVQHAAFTGQHISGIITKRSRGRRVPNNPEELNNLGKSGKVYTCKVPGCGKCFKRSEHLKRHVRSIHTDEKPFMCHCGKTFSRHDNLNQHARVHQQGYNSHLGSPLAVSNSGSLSPAVSALSLNSPDTRRNQALMGSRLRCGASDNEALQVNDGSSDFFRLDA